MFFKDQDDFIAIVLGFTMKYNTQLTTEVRCLQESLERKTWIQT